MFSRISIFRIFSVLLVVMFMPALVVPAFAVPVLRETEGLAGPVSLLQFTSRGHILGFTPQGMYAATGSHALRVDFVNANNVQPQADASANSQSASLGRVAYADLWEGVSLEYTASAGSIYITTYNLTPGADAKNIRLRYNAPVRVDEAGNLRIAFETGEMTESAPIAWQVINGQRVAVQVDFRLLDSPIQNPKSKFQNPMVTFALGKYDPRHALTIDPSLTWNTFTWNTFLGGGDVDDGRAIAVDGSGNVYVAGNSYAPWGSLVRRTFSGDRDGFVAKLNSSGSLLWNTFLGGIGLDAANGIALDGSGNIYVVGDSTVAWTCDFPIPPDCTIDAYHGETDAYAAQLNPSGDLMWNTFIGGIYTDYGTAIAVDTSSNPNVIWVAGDYKWTFDFDALVIKLDLSGTVITFAFLGGGGGDNFANGIAVDGSGNVYVTGDSDTDWGGAWGLPVRAHQGGVDAFAAKLDSSANLLWHTFLGGSGTDHGYGIAVDGNREVYVTGESNAAWSCLDVGGCTVQDHHGGTDAFAAKLYSSGYLAWNTFLGLGGNDSGHGIAVDGSGNIFVTGNIDGYNNFDPFTTQLSSLSGATMANIFLGGSGNDYGNGIAVMNGTAYVAGASTATWGSPPVRDFTNLGGQDAFVAKVDFIPPTVNTFIATSPSTSWNIPITAFTASDNNGVTGYLITESPTPPSAGVAGWSGTAPTIYPVGSNGSYTLYPWAKDAAGNVSAVFGTPRTVTVTRVYKLFLPLILR